jgi:hypothetical protein
MHVWKKKKKPTLWLRGWINIYILVSFVKIFWVLSSIYTSKYIIGISLNICRCKKRDIPH